MSQGSVADVSDDRSEEWPSTARPRTRRSKIIGGGLLALLAVGILFAVFSAYEEGPQIHSLLDRATRVPGYTITSGGYPSTWTWSSGSQIQFQDTRNTVLRLDVTSGSQSRVPANLALARTQNMMVNLGVYASAVKFGFAGPKGPFPDGVPSYAEVTGVGASPDGRRLAWWVAWGKQSPAWMDRLMGWVRRQPLSPLVPPQTTEAILISDRDGSHMRELGRVKAEYAPDGLGAISWTPDSKRLVILYKLGLYTLPAD